MRLEHQHAYATIVLVEQTKRVETLLKRVGGPTPNEPIIKHKRIFSNVKCFYMGNAI